MNFAHTLKFAVALAACFAVQTGFAQSTTEPDQATQSVAVNNGAMLAPSASSATLAPVLAEPAGKTRADVMRELQDFQKSGQAAVLRDLYRGS
jgi:hypothetical protein